MMIIGYLSKATEMIQHIAAVKVDYRLYFRGKYKNRCWIKKWALIRFY